MPYDHYTKVTRQDALAIKAWLFSLPPVHTPANRTSRLPLRHPRLAWPPGARCFSGPERSCPTHRASAERIAALTWSEGLGHCGSCHTPRNILSGSEQTRRCRRRNHRPGVVRAQHHLRRPGRHRRVEPNRILIGYLRTGIAPGHAIAAGPMAGRDSRKSAIFHGRGSAPWRRG